MTTEPTSIAATRKLDRIPGRGLVASCACLDARSCHQSAPPCFSFLFSRLCPAPSRRIPLLPPLLLAAIGRDDPLRRLCAPVPPGALISLVQSLLPPGTPSRPSKHARTLTIAQIENHNSSILQGVSADATSAPVGVNPTCGILRVGHDGSLANIANIIVCGLSITFTLLLILWTTRRRAAVGESFSPCFVFPVLPLAPAMSVFPLHVSFHYRLPRSCRHTLPSPFCFLLCSRAPLDACPCARSSVGRRT